MSVVVHEAISGAGEGHPLKGIREEHAVHITAKTGLF